MEPITQQPAVCNHCRAVLDGLLARGASVLRVETCWSAAELVVVLDKGLTPALAEEVAGKAELEFWQNNDAHYSIEYGLFCNEHKQGISWPQSAADIADLS